MLAQLQDHWPGDGHEREHREEVEMGIISTITAAVDDIPDDSLDALRLNVAQEAARINGITFEDADEWQNGGECLN